MAFLGEFSPNYRYKGFHKNGYMTPVQTSSNHSNPLQDNRRVTQFVAKGIDKIDPSLQGLQYGSGQEHNNARRINEQNFADKLKRQRQLQHAEDDLRTYRERKKKEDEEKIIEQKKDLEMLKDYHPWGAGGGGAPRYTNSGDIQARRQRISDASTLNEKDAVYNPFGKPGGGAPRRSESGTAITTVIADPNTRFQKQLKREVEHSLRYKDDHKDDKPYATPTTTPIKLKRTESEVERRKLDKEEKTKYAIRLDKQIKEQQLHQTKQETSSSLSFYPWGRDHPSRDGSGKILRRPRVLEKSSPLEDESKKIEGGWLLRLGEKTQSMKIPKTKDTKNDYDPWGKPGGGAPLTSDDGKKIANVFGNFGGRKDLIMINRTTDDNGDSDSMELATWLRRGCVGQPKKDTDNGIIIGGQMKQTSDVTSQRFDIRRAAPQQTVPYHSPREVPLEGKPVQEPPYHSPPKEASPPDESKSHPIDLPYHIPMKHPLQVNKDERMRIVELHKKNHLWQSSDLESSSNYQDKLKTDYKTDLISTMKQRKQINTNNKQQQLEQEKQHIQAFNDIWGRPGGGAPRRNKVTLQVETAPRNYGVLLSETTNTSQYKYRRL